MYAFTKYLKAQKYMECIISERDVRNDVGS